MLEVLELRDKEEVRTELQKRVRSQKGMTELIRIFEKKIATTHHPKKLKKCSPRKRATPKW